MMKQQKPIWEILEGSIETDEDIARLQEMVDNGSIWGFQGSVGRMAADLLEQGVLKFPEKRTHDFYGNPIPTKEEYAEHKVEQ